MTLTHLLIIFAAGLTALRFISIGIANATLAEQKRNEAKRHVCIDRSMNNEWISFRAVR